MPKKDLRSIFIIGFFSLFFGILIGINRENIISKTNALISEFADDIYVDTRLSTGSLWISYTDIKKIANKNSKYDDFYSDLRSSLVSQLIEKKFSDFRRVPFSQGNNILTIGSGDKYFLSGKILETDILDDILQKYLSGFEQNFDKQSGSNQKKINLTSIEIDSQQQDLLENIFLFKSQRDLEKLGYEVISSRERVNKDQQYRRNNIKTAFEKLGNIRIINTSGSLSFLGNIDANNPSNKTYSRGQGIFEDKLIPMYAGGICGASTALYQGILTNKGLEVIERGGHSKRYQHLYPATINGNFVSTPGIDSVVYGDLIDLRIKNVSNYPIILVLNFDGLFGGKEAVFTLGKIEDKGSYSFVGKFTKGNYKCYTRKINDKDNTTCYKEILK